MKVTLVVKVIDADDQVIGAYYSMANLPFMPTIGMKFKQSSSIHLWKTIDGFELNPSVIEIVYNLDDKEV